MAKGRGGFGSGFGGGFPNMQDMMRQVQKMAEETQKIEEELGELKIEASSGGGMVKAVVNGKGELLEVVIDPQVVDPEDVEMLQDLVVSAVREALEKAAEAKAGRLQELTGGFSLPGLF